MCHWGFSFHLLIFLSFYNIINSFSKLFFIGIQCTLYNGSVVPIVAWWFLRNWEGIWNIWLECNTDSHSQVCGGPEHRFVVVLPSSKSPWLLPWLCKPDPSMVQWGVPVPRRLFAHHRPLFSGKVEHCVFTVCWCLYESINKRLEY